jgi:hypothetical protein
MNRSSALSSLSFSSTLSAVSPLVEAYTSLTRLPDRMAAEVCSTSERVEYNRTLAEFDEPRQTFCGESETEVNLRGALGEMCTCPSGQGTPVLAIALAADLAAAHYHDWASSAAMRDVLRGAVRRAVRYGERINVPLLRRGMEESYYADGTTHQAGTIPSLSSDGSALEHTTGTGRTFWSVRELDNGQVSVLVEVRRPVRGFSPEELAGLEGEGAEIRPSPYGDGVCVAVFEVVFENATHVVASALATTSACEERHVGALLTACPPQAEGLRNALRGLRDRLAQFEVPSE